MTLIAATIRIVKRESGAPESGALIEKSKTSYAGRRRDKRWLVVLAAGRYASGMFSHIVIFWTKPDQPNAADALIAGAEQHLKPIPGGLTFHVGRMVTDGRSMVESSYQVALTTVFASRQARE